MAEMQDYLEICNRAARTGGRILRDWQGRIQAKQKAPRDLVTEADVASQQAIRKILLEAFPAHGFIGEEELAPLEGVSGGHEDPLSAEYCWIVDPLDGTTNFVHQLPSFAVSIALKQGEQLAVGAVYDPWREECYTAEKQAGAYLNGARLQTSRCERLEDALVATSFSARVPRGSVEIARFIEVLHSCQAIRRLGSAALNLSYLAAGRLDAYWATCVKNWDVAAGVLLVREAGGIVTGIDGNPFDLRNPHFVASATPQLHEELLAMLGRFQP